MLWLISECLIDSYFTAYQPFAGYFKPENIFRLYESFGDYHLLIEILLINS